MEKVHNPSLEWWFDQWAQELQKAGYIKEIVSQDKCPTYILQEPEYHDLHSERIIYKGTKREQLKKETKRITVVDGIKYTPDRGIKWSDKAFDVLHRPQDLWKWDAPNPFFKSIKHGSEYYSLLDVKAPAGYGNRNCSDVSFAIKSKLVWAQYGIHINKCMLIPNKPVRKQNIELYLFASTFTPQRYLWTDAITKLRTIPNKDGVSNWKVRTLQEFLSEQLP